MRSHHSVGRIGNEKSVDLSITNSNCRRYDYERSCINVSKRRSTVAVIQLFEVVISKPFEVLHTDSNLKKLVTFIESLLHLFVSVVNLLLIDDYDKSG